MTVLPECMSVHHFCAWCPQRSEEGIGSPEARVVSQHVGAGE